jgi:sigma-E factor negative regulatory protein RseB
MILAARSFGFRRAALTLSLGCAFLLAARILPAQQPVAAPVDEGLQWLERMDKALSGRNYDGVFFHVRDGRVETLRIIHSVQGDAVRERLVSLDGSGREFVRTGEELICYLPDKRTVLVEHRSRSNSLLGNLPRFDNATNEHYEISKPERARLMGRDARMVEIRPRDQYRFGYRLWIDEVTAMPLKSQLCDTGGRVLEQVVFARLTLPAKISDDLLQTRLKTEGFQWLRAEKPQALTATPAQQAAADSAANRLWNVMRLPPGFRLTTRSLQSLPGVSDPATHLVFSDGLATVSVFVEPPREVEKPGSAAQLGVSSAYSTRIAGLQVTAVGEVPMATVQFFARQARPSIGTSDGNSVLGDDPNGTPGSRNVKGRGKPPSGMPAFAPSVPR